MEITIPPVPLAGSSCELLLASFSKVMFRACVGLLGTGVNFGQLGFDSTVLDLESRRFDFVSERRTPGACRQGLEYRVAWACSRLSPRSTDKLRKDLGGVRDRDSEAGLQARRTTAYPSGEFDASARSVLADLGVISATTCRPGWSAEWMTLRDIICRDS